MLVALLIPSLIFYMRKQILFVDREVPTCIVNTSYDKHLPFSKENHVNAS
jgi:hypothetical protein